MQGQQPVSIHLSEKDGLPDKEFYTITEDSKGFIWLCADKGLFRFDGKNYKSYSHKAQRGLSLFNAQEDHLGRIWCNNISGQFFYTQNKNLELFIDLSEKLKGELVDFIVDKNNLWALGLREIIKVNLKTKAITSTFRVNDRILGVPAILNNKIYVANSETVYAVSKAEEVEKEFEINLPFKNKNGKNIPVEKAMLFQMDTLLIYNQRRFDKNEFYYLNPDLNAVTKVSDFKAFADQRIFTKLIKENEIWFGTTSGVWVYKKTNVGFVLKKRFFENRNITKIIEDAAANYWFATLNNGIYVIPNIDVEIANIPEHHNNITSLETLNDSTLLFGSVRGNVGIHNIKNNKTRIVNLPTNDRVSVIKFHRKNNLAYISKDVSGYVLNPLSLKVDRVSKIITAKSLTPLNDGTLLFTTNNNIGLLYGTSFESYINQKQTKNKRTYASHFKAKANKVFVAYIDNLVVYDSLWRQKTIRYKNQSIFGKSITETVDGTLWVSTFKNGVFGIKNDVIVKHYTTENGLTSNRIEMVEGDQNKLWIALDNSIQLLDVASNTFEMFTKSDGVLSYAISGVEPLESKVYFSSNEGVFSINKQRVTKNKAPKVYINAVEVNEKEQSITSNYKLKHDENTIKISYNVNGFQFNQKGKYAYRLLGLNDSWVTSETGVNSVKYNSLPSGNYTFEVKPILDNNTKEAKVETLDFSISKPFWKTWWFILSTSIFIFGTTILYFRNKIKKKESQNKKQLKKLALDNDIKLWLAFDKQKLTEVSLLKKLSEKIKLVGVFENGDLVLAAKILNDERALGGEHTQYGDSTARVRKITKLSTDPIEIKKQLRKHCPDTEGR